MHFYRLFGLNIQSEFKFPFLNETSVSIPDVIIVYGITPNNLKEIKNKGVLFQSGDLEFLFWVNNICRYYVSNGNNIIIDKKPDASDKDIYAFMAGSVFGALLQQRGLIALHGCTVEKNGKTIIFLGKTGTGKSTLGLHLYRKGYNIISDDISVLNFDQSDIISVQKGPSYIKVWLDVLKRYNVQYKELQTLRDNINKYIFPVIQKINPTQLSTIFVIRNVNKTGIQQTNIKGVDKFDMLVKNIYKPQFAKNTFFEKKSFMALTKLAKTVNLYKIDRGQDKFYQDTIENHLNQI